MNSASWDLQGLRQGGSLQRAHGTPPEVEQQEGGAGERDEQTPPEAGRAEASWKPSQMPSGIPMAQ